ncbi:MAG: PTS sugar transporter subunit IIA [Candidatus Tyloplasma litorale]|nr:MAG: PTS sugar transporter subunit IIA [Mycoplasmatales bacterium]
MDTKAKKKTNVKFTKEKRNFSFLSLMQNIGKSLVYPIATLPAAALLLRIGAFVNSYGVMDGSGWEQFLYWLGFILQTPGSAVFDNLPIIFGIGVAFGFAKENRGEVALVGAIAYFALIGLAQNEGSLSSLFYENVDLGNAYRDPVTNQVINSDLLYLNVFVNESLASSTWLMNFGVFGGILTGLTTAAIYNKWHSIRLHPALGFFSGRRFVPIITLFIMILVSFIMAIIWPWINIALVQISIGISKVPTLGAGLYAFANRLLIPFGLHQVLNTYFWFQAPIVASLNNSTEQLLYWNGTEFTPLLGDINAFSYVIDGTIFQVAGNNYMLHVENLGQGSWLETGAMVDGIWNGTGQSAAQGIDVLRSANIGMYQAGFYPTMMFGLPAVAVAISMRAENEYRNKVWAFMLAGAAVAFLTGITEPLEFSFMFISPIIYVVYSMIAGIFASITIALGISVGFGFSAGFIDWMLSLLSGGIGTLSSTGNWASLELIAVGVVAAIVNFSVVYWLIGRFNISTPGRNGNVTGLSGNEDDENNNPNSPTETTNDKLSRIAKKTIDFVGKENIENVDNCITRLRLIVKDNSVYKDEDAIAIGYTGVVKVGKKAYQLILGPDCEVVANEIKRLLASGYGSKPKEKVKN